MNAASIVLQVLALIASGLLILFRMMRRRELRRLALDWFGLWIGLLLLALLFRGRAALHGNPVLYILGKPWLWLLPCCAGLAVIRGAIVRPWLGFLGLAEAWHPGRRSGSELLLGLLLAWPLAFLHVARADNVALYFAFLIPLFSRWVRNQVLRLVLLAVVGAVLFAGMAKRPELGLLYFALCVATFRVSGLLGVFAASIAGSLLQPFTLFGAVVYAAAVGSAVWLRSKGAIQDGRELEEELARRSQIAGSLRARSERDALNAEFAEARAAQMGMLPDSTPTLAGYSVAAVCQPAREVGGDLFDILEFPDARWGFCVADVSGKGVPAALYMTMTKGLLASERPYATDLRELALALNERLHEAGRHKTFVTMALASLDPATRRLTLIRAGHNPVLWRRARRNETVWLRPEGLGLGLVSNRMFGRKLEEQVVDLEPGDAVILYSDGLTEAENPRVELFGEERLQAIAEKPLPGDAQTLVDEILADVERFKEGAEPHDDLTLLVIKVLD